MLSWFIRMLGLLGMLLLEGEGGDGGAGDGGTGNQGDPGAGAGGEGAEGDPDAQLIKDPGKLLELVKELRGYEKGEKLPPKVQKQLDDLQGKVTAAQRAQMTEVDRIKAENEDYRRRIGELEGKLTTQSLSQAILGAASDAGAKYPEDVARLIDQSQVKQDDNGKPTNLRGLIEDVRKRRPDYFKPGGGNGRVDGGARPPAPGDKPDMNKIIRQSAAR